MKLIFEILSKTIKEPRFIMQSISLNRKQLASIIILINILLALSSLVHIIPLTHNLANDVANASNFLPEFKQTMTGKLDIAEGDKPLYYQSDNFQLVIDDTITYHQDGSIPISNEQRGKMSSNSLMSLFLFENTAFFLAQDNLIEIPLQIDIFRSPNNLRILLNYYKNHLSTMLMPVFIILLVASILTYFIELGLLTFFLGIFSIPMIMQTPFKARFKLVVIASIYPIILVELLSFIFTIPLGRYLWIMVLTIFNIQRMIVDHSKFLYQLFDSSKFDDKEEFVEHFKTALKNLEVDKEKENNKDKNDTENEDDSDDPK